MTGLTPRRLIAISLLAVVALGLAGLAWTAIRFGITTTGTAARVERHVRETVDRQVDAVVSLARRAAGDPALIGAAISSRDELPRLFEHLAALAETPSGGVVATTVYVPDTPRGFRVLAWTDGPGDQSLSDDRLAGPATVFVAPGHAGLRLIALEPVALPGGARAVAASETILEPAERAATEPERRMSTPYGPVTVISHYASTRDATTSDGFVIATDSGAPLIEVRIDRAALAAHRAAFIRRLAAVALIPLPIGLAMAAASIGHRQRRASRGRHLAALGMRAAAVAGVAALLAALARFGGAPSVLVRMVGAVALLILVVQIPGGAWWRVRPQHRARRAAIFPFVVEHLAGGALLAAAIEIVARLLDRWMTLTVLDRGPFVLFPFAMGDVASTGTLLLLEASAAWTAASVLALLAIRWQVVPFGSRTLAAVALWVAPTVALLMLGASQAGAMGAIVLVPAAAAVGFALVAPRMRRYYGRRTQSARLGLALLAGFVPLVALYPLAAVTADRTTREVIAGDYAPATAGHPQELRAELERAQQQVDAMPGLAQLVGGMPSDDSQAAYLVWSRTGLQRSRVISDVELYGRDRALVSRFAFNLPEYVYRRTLQSWQGSSCTWDEQGVFGEVTPFGAEERLMLHAERGVCDEAGRLLGGIVLHVASNDYQALPFISSPSPYYDALSVTDTGPRLPDLTLAVYGWSSQPIFTSGRAAWSVAPETFDRLYRTGEPFWTSLSADGRRYHVHFSQNRAGIYALGYPSVTPIEHATRLAEIAALVAVFFVAWQIALLLTSPPGRPHTPLRHLLHEVRTSFYRKLFISFVVVAVLPVLAAAVAFGGYMAARFRADVEFEASSTVAVAQRVFQELTAAGARPVELQSEPSDDVMVWIRQVIDEDVNLFDGPQLLATSQSDLFDSGILPMRTPAAVYRGIALERRPSMVAEDHLGAFQYLVAAAPVSAGRRDAVLTVSLAPRQREMARELDTLNRRVLVGAVLVVLFGAGVGASLASRISDPVARLTRATREIAAGRLDVRVTTDTADELRRLVEDFNSMAQTLGAQRAELARANQLKAWNEMARQVAHEIKNPLTPVQLAAEHLQHVHEDRGRPLGAVLDRCVATVLTQVRLLRQIASEFANFAGEPTRRPASVEVAPLVAGIVDPYRVGLGDRIEFVVEMPPDLPAVWADRTLVSRALTNLVENAVQAMPRGGTLRVAGSQMGDRVRVDVADTGVGMDALALEHAFEPYFSTKTGGSGLGLANARRNVEREGGTIEIVSAPGAGTTVTVTLPLAAGLPAAP